LPSGAAAARHLHRLMREWVGFGAKRLSTIVRFQATLHHMEHSPRESAASLASENGYFDQSHLSVDAARFAGATPRALSSRHVADFSKTRCDDLL
jgi:methylphosphotriester-DNA--protein-cysteine methyltransferase